MFGVRGGALWSNKTAIISSDYGCDLLRYHGWLVETVPMNNPGATRIHGNRAKSHPE